MNVKFGRIVLAMILALTLDAVAKTVAWYRFDDFAPGTVTASGDTFANTAENSNVPAATPHAQNNTSWGTDADYMPRCIQPFTGLHVGILDPVTGQLHPNRSSLKFQGESGSATVNPASAVSVPNDTLRLTSFTAECFFKAPTNIAAQTMSTLLHMQRQMGAATWTLQLYGGGLFVRSTIKKASGVEVKCDYGKYNISTVTNGLWHHAAITFDAETPEMKLWLDYSCLHTWTYSEWTGFDYKDNSYFQIGANTVQSGRNFPGEMDEVRISDTALAADQFLHLASLWPDDPDTLVRISLDGGDLHCLPTALWAPGFNEVTNCPYTVTLRTSGTPTTETFNATNCTETVSDWIGLGAFGATNRNAGAMLSLTNALVKGQWIVVNDKTAAIDTNSFTAECFVKFNLYSKNGDNADHNQTPMGGASFRFIMDLRKSWHSQLVMRTFTNSAMAYTQSTLSSTQHPFADWGWHHIAVVHDAATSNISYYVDYERRTTCNYKTLRGGLSSDNRGLVFGANSFAGAQPLSGWIDECRVMKRALHPDEFLTRTHCEGPVRAWFDFEDDLLPKPNPLGVVAGEGSPVREQKAWGRSVRDATNGVVRDVQRNSLHVNSGRHTTKRLTQAELQEFTVELQLCAADFATSRAVVAQRATRTNSRTWSLMGRPGEVVEVKTNLLSLALSTVSGIEEVVDWPDVNYADNKWHHLAFSVGNVDDTSEVKLYADHVCVKTARLQSRYFPPAVHSDDTGLVIGSAYMHAYVDELRVLEGVRGPEDFLYAPPPAGTMIMVR